LCIIYEYNILGITSRCFRGGYGPFGENLFLHVLLDTMWL